jgi:DNA-binding HxlR family transcriptional regulator
MSVTHIDVRLPEPCGSPEHEDCGLRDVLDRLGERWTVMTIAELGQGTRRYTEIERALEGISQRMLTLTLRRLERDGLVDRMVEATVPPAVSYRLTERGLSFAKLVNGLVDWSKANKQATEEARRQYDAATA